MKFGNRHVENYGPNVFRLDYHPHVYGSALPFFAGPINVPASAH
jgi:hypothetical protein